MSNVTVVIVNDRAYPGGGASKVALTSAIGLRKRGYRVIFFAAQGPVDSSLVKAGIEVRLLDQADLLSGGAAVALQGWWNARAKRELAAILGELPRASTVIHIHSWSKALSPSIFSAIAVSSIRAIMTLHDYGYVCPNLALYNYKTGQNCPLTPMSPACLSTDCDSRAYHHKLWRVGRQLSLRHVAESDRALSAVAFVSEYERQIYEPYLSPHLSQVVIANPVTMENSGAADPARHSDFLYVGRLSREKGVLLLADAAQRSGIAVTMVGDGPLRAEVHAANPQLRVTGWLEPQQVKAWLYRARAVILPALWRETHGMAVSEAMAAGLPCIVSSGTAPASFVRDGVTGLHFQNGDADALGEVLLRLLHDDALAHRLGQAAFADYWKAPLTPDAHLDRLCEVYARLLGKNASPTVRHRAFI